MIGISILGILGHATGLQTLPFALFTLLGYMQLYNKIDVKLYILILSVIMILINISIFSWLDILLWLFTFVVFAL